MQPIRSFKFACLALAALAGLSGQAFSASVAVGNCTNLVHFSSIQLAVSSSPVGSTILICPGIYPEQVSITQNLVLKGIPNPLSPTQDSVLIVPPTTGMVQNAVDLDDVAIHIAAQIVVNGATVSISNLTVDGKGNGITGCGPDLQGILYQNASGTLTHVAVRNQALVSSLGGCQSGEGIFVQTGVGMTSKVSVLSSSVHGYQKNGITGNDAGTTLNVTSSYVQGSGVVPVPGAAQNGIQLGFGATGKITGNTVIDNIYGDPTIAASADILLYDTAEVGPPTVAGNTLGNSQLPIVLFTDFFGSVQSGDGVSVTNNKIFGTAVYDAIDVCTSSNTVTGNTISNSSQSGIHLDTSCGAFGGAPTGNSNLVIGNTFVESACAGILADGATSGNTTAPNMYFAVPATITGTCPVGPARGRKARKYSPAR